MRQFLAIATALIVAAGSLQAAGLSYAQSKGEVVIGVQCDRTGPTQIVGTVYCPAFHDYIALVNSKGGVEGFKIKALEIDHEYKVPPAVESYERHKKDGAVTMAIYGTPQIYALAAKLTEDRIPETSPRRKDSSSRPSRYRRPASRWAPRCWTSRSASAPTSWSRTSSAARRRCRSRSSSGSATRSARSCRSFGARPRPTSMAPAASASPRATTRCSSPGSAPTIPC